MLAKNSNEVEFLTAILLSFTREDYIALGKVVRFMVEYSELLGNRAVLQRVMKAAKLIEEVTE